MDTVEIVMEVEEQFEISIPDEEASKCYTVGDLWAYILSRLPQARTARCHTAAAFYCLRKALVDVLGVPRRSIRPETELAGHLPLTGRRRRDWKRVGQQATVEMPPLERPNWLCNIMNLGAAATMILIGAWLFRYLEVGACIVVAFLSLIPYYITACLLTRPLAVGLPRHCKTAGDAARAILVGNFRTFVRTGEAAHRNDVWFVLRRIVSEQLGVEEKIIKPESRFVEDLNVG